MPFCKYRRNKVNKPIYKLYLIRPSASWYSRSKAEQDALFAKVRNSLEKVGGKTVLTCNSRWSSEEWAAFGLEEFPDLNAVQKHSELLEELHWPFEFGKAYSILGTKAE